jgi:hypothetical protein
MKVISYKIQEIRVTLGGMKVIMPQILESSQPSGGHAGVSMGLLAAGPEGRWIGNLLAAKLASCSSTSMGGRQRVGEGEAGSTTATRSWLAQADALAAQAVDTGSSGGGGGVPPRATGRRALVWQPPDVRVKTDDERSVSAVRLRDGADLGVRGDLTKTKCDQVVRHRAEGAARQRVPEVEAGSKRAVQWWRVWVRGLGRVENT